MTRHDESNRPSVIGVVAIGRPTFDLSLAHSNTARAIDLLEGRGVTLSGSGEVLTDADLVEAAVSAMADEIDLLLVMQATFSDATMVDAAARRWQGPISIWGFPEERTGGRLRLNSFCGMNLAAYRLRSIGRQARHLYASVESAGDGLEGLLRMDTPTEPRSGAVAPAEAGERVLAAVHRLRSSSIGVVGDPPDGFYPCVGDAQEIHSAFGTDLQRIDLERLFAEATAATPGAVAEGRAGFAGMDRIEDLPGGEVERSARLGSGLEEIRGSLGLDALAVRCWPECFTEYGAAACAAIGLLNDRGVPATCEADVYGCLTGLALGEISDGANVSIDLVDPDVSSGTAVLWHCGQLPPSMATDGIGAIPHPNRGIGVLAEFALRPGRVTIARLTRAGGSHSVVVGSGEMLETPRPFSGTCGVMRFDTDMQQVIDTVLGLGLDHHLGLTYGDHREELIALAEELSLPVIEI